MKIRGKIFLLLGILILIIVAITSSFDRFYLEEYYMSSRKEGLAKIASRVKYEIIDIEEVSEEGIDAQIDVLSFELIDLQLQSLSDEDIEDIRGLKEDIDDYLFKELEDGEYGNKRMFLFTALDDREILAISTSINSITDSLEIISGFHRRLVVVIAVISMLISIYISKLISKPVVKIEAVADSYARKDFSPKVINNSKDEIGRLSRSINTMGESLRENIEELERANRKLQEDIEKEKKIDKMRREFISNVSHELKTPIAIISNYIEGIKDGLAEDKDTLDFYLDIIDDETNSMNELVHKLLVLSKLETKYDDLVIEKLNLSEMIEEELGKVSPVIIEKSARIERKIDSEISFSGDEATMSMVIKNFINNSAKYVDSNGIIEVVLCKGKFGKRFEIYNTMDGEVEDVDKLWEPFYREDEARNREEGTGLGLSIVKEILEKHNYDFGIIKDNGLRFWFEEKSV